MRCWILLGACVPFLAACAAKPVLYPNDHLSRVGDAQSKHDIAECRELADDYVRSHPVAQVAEKTVQGGAVGGAAGAAGGAVLGHAARGAEVGAAAGAAGAAARGIFKTRQPSSTYKHFVNRCLKERGYDVIGWE